MKPKWFFDYGIGYGTWEIAYGAYGEHATSEKNVIGWGQPVSPYVFCNSLVLLFLLPGISDEN